MTNEQLLKYFDKRPKADNIFLVGQIVFVDPKVAGNYAKQVGGKVEIKTREQIIADAEGNGIDISGDDEITREAAEAKLAGMELDENTDYYEAKKLVKALELLTDGKSKEDYLVALSAEKVRLANNIEDNEGSTTSTETTE